MRAVSCLYLRSLPILIIKVVPSLARRQAEASLLLPLLQR
ncbi:hypothetical protein HMPREF1556_01623 [Porphyromonas sp. oral taxon 278 str. W7784]|nr:hypothetical protein HMPREF1556_01623 [Porphyromonas sp. oral taxon 278 str. W7784]